MYIKIDEYVKKQILVAACVNIGHILSGYTVSWTAPVIPKMQQLHQTPLVGVISVSQASWMGSVMYIGIIIGANMSGVLSLMMGRKRSILFGNIIAIAGYIILLFSYTYEIVLLGRLISSMGSGLICVVDLVYIGEFASSEIRGAILTSTGIFHSLGCLIIYDVGPFITYYGTIYVALAICIVHLFGCFYIPESPIYYAIKGKEEAAKAVLRKLGRDKDIANELLAVFESVQKNQEQNTSKWREIITVKSNRKSLVITTTLFIAQQWSGIMAISIFMTTIFQAASSSIDPDTATLIVGVLQLFGSLITSFLVEKSGRKILLMISTSGGFICMLVLGVYFYLQHIHDPSIHFIRWLPLAVLVVHMLIYSIGLNIIPGTLLGEMFSPEVRSLGSSICLTIGWFMGFISIIAFGYIVDALGSHVIFWVFSAVNAAAFVFTLVFVPETKGMTLSEIVALLSK